jgi:Kyanoviridae head maturation protease
METQTTDIKIEKPHARLLVDSRLVKLDLLERGESGKVVLRGEFARCGVPTENKRVYPHKLWEREIGRLRKSMGEHALFGHLDHPTSGRTELAKASHKVTNLEIKDGLIIGEAEVMDTTEGKNLKAILQSGGRVGISSRGYGSTRTNEKGEEIVQEDYRLVTFDFVADPADQNAFPEVFYEHNEGSVDKDDEAKQAQEWARKLEMAKTEGRSNAEASLREEFTRETLKLIAEMRASVVDEVRGELLSDPSVAGARTALDKIKDVLRPFVLPEDAKAVSEQKDAEIAKHQKTIAEQSLRIKDLEDENSKLASVAKEAGYKFFVENQIAGDPDAELIRKLIGDVKLYKTSEDLKSKIEIVRADLAEKREKETKLAEQIEGEKQAERERKESERARAIKSEKVLREENEKLRTALEKSVAANKGMVVQLYAEGRLANHPKASRIRKLIEARSPETREEVDAILEEFREPASPDPEQQEAVRARIRKFTKGGQGPTALDEEFATPSNGSPYKALGVSVGQLRELAGLGENSHGQKGS